MIKAGLLFFCIKWVSAEYRAYQYVVQDKIQDPNIVERGLIVSTLDPVSYLAYNGGADMINVELIRTWKCPGDTSLKNICSSPYKKLLLSEISNE